jgi:hypothetical protein
MRCLLLLLFATVLTGCSKTALVEGVPNYYQVDKCIRRSGQPTTKTQWQTIWNDLEQSCPGRPHYVIKMNYDDEGSDDLATSVGFIVIKHPIEPANDKDVFDNVLNTFVEPTDEQMQAIESDIDAHKDDGEVDHCSHGQDRTGIAEGEHRVLHDHWTKDQAYAEMVKLGFHGLGGQLPPLDGLNDKWDQFDPKTWPKSNTSLKKFRRPTDAGQAPPHP